MESISECAGHGKEGRGRLVQQKGKKGVVPTLSTTAERSRRLYLSLLDTHTTTMEMMKLKGNGKENQSCVPVGLDRKPADVLKLCNPRCL